MSALRRWVFLLTFGFICPGLAQDIRPHGAIVSFGLWDAQKVFQLEAARGAHVLASRFAGITRTTVRSNSPGKHPATESSLRSALLASAAKMDLAHDVLFVFLTSHGSQDGIAIKNGRNVSLISPAQMAGMLKGSGFKYRVLIVSACYSGVFADYLADANTLVITAADAEHPSFGCTNTATRTYFGKAFFDEGLQATNSLPQAFALAKISLAKREASEGFEASNPQIAGGEAVLPLLRAMAK